MRWRRLAARAGLCGLLCAALAWVGVERWIATAPVPSLSVETSDLVLDRDGRLLRAYTVADGRWRLALSPQDTDAGYVAMLLAYEDKRFYRHGGVDAWAVIRAAWQLARNGRVVSGASTLTMQVARLLVRAEGEDTAEALGASPHRRAPPAHPRAGVAPRRAPSDGTRSLSGKLAQMRLALALERRLSKAEILALYLQLAPFGGNIEGVRAASPRQNQESPPRPRGGGASPCRCRCRAARHRTG